MSLIYVCCAWLCGIYFGRTWGFRSQYLWLIVPLLVVVIWRLRRRHPGRFAAILALVFAFGVLRMGVSLPHMGADSVARYCDQVVGLTGTVIEPPEIRDSWSNLTLAVDSLVAGEEHLAATGRVLISTSRYPQFQSGDYLQVEGYLRLPSISEDFSYRDYLSRQDIFSLMSYPKITLLQRRGVDVFTHLLYSIRQTAQSTIEHILPDPEAALLSGVLLGLYRGIPEKLGERFNATGTSHIIVISGFNITILAAIQLRLFNQFLSRRRAVWISILGVGFYTLLVGADAAVIRAAIMGIAVLFAILVGRQNDALISLSLAALLMTLWDPLSLWDLSFQLSAGATLGLILFASSVYRRVQSMLPSAAGRSLTPLVKDTLTATLAAQIFTLPLILYNFHRMSLIMPVANVLILPAQPPLMISGAVALVAGSIWLPLGQIAGWVAWLFLTYTIRVVDLLGSIPFASIETGHLPAWSLWIYYLLVISVAWLHSQNAEQRAAVWRAITSRLPAKALVVALLLASLVIWSAAFSMPDGRLHVRFLNIGQGDAILITAPDGKQILIDGGPSPAAVLSELGRAMPFWDHEIELMVLSHPDQDHLLGLIAVLERYRVDQVLDSAIDDKSGLSSEWQRVLREKGMPVRKAQAGMSYDLGAGIKMDVLYPAGDVPLAEGTSVNDVSTVLRLAYGDVSFLFTGDLEAAGEHSLLQSGQQVDSTVLKVSHHGAKQATTTELVEAVSPQLAVISVGDNNFGHPTRETLDRLQRVTVLRTDIAGTIDVQTDGVDCWSDRSP